MPDNPTTASTAPPWKFWAALSNTLGRPGYKIMWLLGGIQERIKESEKSS